MQWIRDSKGLSPDARSLLRRCFEIEEWERKFWEKTKCTDGLEVPVKGEDGETVEGEPGSGGGGGALQQTDSDLLLDALLDDEDDDDFDDEDDEDEDEDEDDEDLDEEEEVPEE